MNRTYTPLVVFLFIAFSWATSIADECERIYYHNDGKNACLREAVIYAKCEKLISGDRVRAKDFKTLSGEKVYPGQKMICGSCGKNVFWGFRIKNFGKLKKENK